MQCRTIPATRLFHEGELQCRTIPVTQQCSSRSYVGVNMPRSFDCRKSTARPERQFKSDRMSLAGNAVDQVALHSVSCNLPARTNAQTQLLLRRPALRTSLHRRANLLPLGSIVLLRTVAVLRAILTDETRTSDPSPSLTQPTFKLLPRPNIKIKAKEIAHRIRLS